jgi:hypothetical protein
LGEVSPIGQMLTYFGQFLNKEVAKNFGNTFFGKFFK